MKNQEIKTITLKDISFIKLKSFVKELSKNNSKINGVFSLVGQYTIDVGTDSGDMTQKQMIAQMYKEIIAMKQEISKIWQAIGEIKQDIKAINTRIDNIVKKNNLKE